MKEEIKRIAEIFKKEGWRDSYKKAMETYNYIKKEKHSLNEDLREKYSHILINY
jgi:hypothetical protein